MSMLINVEYERLNGYGNILVPYRDMLMYDPDYYKKMVELKKKKFTSKIKLDKFFEDNYKTSELYEKLVSLVMNKEDIYLFMKENYNFKYNYLSRIFKNGKEKLINLYNLIDYIGHYPDTYPEPKEEEKNIKMEKLLEKYDIIVRYYFYDDIDDMQITSDDVVRIITTIRKTENIMNTVSEIISTNDWMFRRKASDGKFKQDAEILLNEIDNFPLSNYQVNGKSKVEEGRMYLGRQKKLRSK